MPFSTHTTFSTLFLLRVSLFSLQRWFHICGLGEQVLPNVSAGHISSVESEKHRKRPFPPAEAAGFRTLNQFPVVLDRSPLGPSSATGQRGALNLSASVNIPVSPGVLREPNQVSMSLTSNWSVWCTSRVPGRDLVLPRLRPSTCFHLETTRWTRIDLHADPRPSVRVIIERSSAPSGPPAGGQACYYLTLFNQNIGNDARVNGD